MQPEYEQTYINYGQKPTLTINGYNFYMTCGACPEQYDVYKDGKLTAYIRLRWGRLSARVPNVEGVEVYVESIGDNGYVGCFEGDDERDRELINVTEAIESYKVHSFN